MTTPKPTPPRSDFARAAAGLALPTLPTSPDVASDTLGHIDAAMVLMAHADQHAADAMACRALDEHGMAGRFAERERMCMKRADLLVAMAQVEALDHIAADLNRLALNR